MINLTEKDADWIANIARQQLQDIQKVQEEVMSTIAKLETEANELINKHPEWEDAKKELEEVKAKSLAENNAYLKEEYAKWQKVIELMMVGSEKNGSN